MIKTLTAIAIAGAAIASSMPIATAQPGCTASGLSSAMGQVASSTGAWLSAHPEAEAAVNTADENAIRTYFATHQAEWSELQGIASPLRSLRQSCPQQVSHGDVARALDHMLVRVREHAWTNVPSVTVAAAEVKPRRPRR